MFIAIKSYTITRIIPKDIKIIKHLLKAKGLDNAATSFLKVELNLNNQAIIYLSWAIIQRDVINHQERRMWNRITKIGSIQLKWNYLELSLKVWWSKECEESCVVEWVKVVFDLDWSADSGTLDEWFWWGDLTVAFA